jgi:hypothetical protein
MADFEIKGFEDAWLLTPTSRVSRLWCRSNLSDVVRRAGDGYVLEEQVMLQVLEQFSARNVKWRGFGARSDFHR